MAMTKKEKEEMEKALTIASLRYTAEVAPDVDPPNSSSISKNGYYYNSSSPRIFEACTSSGFHGYKHNETNSQGSLRLYSTKLLALKALRNAVERESAEKLRLIDKWIEAEKQIPYL